MTALVMLVSAAVFYVLLARVSSIFHLSRVASFSDRMQGKLAVRFAEPEELTVGAHDRKVRSARGAGATAISAGAENGEDGTGASEMVSRGAPPSDMFP